MIWYIIYYISYIIYDIIWYDDVDTDDEKTRGLPSLPSSCSNASPPVNPTQVLGKQRQRRAFQLFTVGPSMSVSRVFVASNSSAMHIPTEQALIFCCLQKQACLVAPGEENYSCYVSPDTSSHSLDLSGCSSHEVVLLSPLTRCFRLFVHCFLIYWALLMRLSPSNRGLKPVNQALESGTSGFSCSSKV